MGKDSITAEDLKKKFKEQIGLMGQANARLVELQQEANQLQSFSLKAQGAAEGSINMLADLIGKEEAEKFKNEILKPKKEEKEDGKN